MMQRQLVGRSHVFRTALAAFVWASQVFAATAHAGDADWKVFGAAPRPNQDPIDLFYDANSIKQSLDGHVAVWVQAFDSGKLADALENGPESKSIASAGLKKLKSGYVLPFSRIQELDDERYAALVFEELVADSGTVPPDRRMLYEIDCLKGMVRAISTTSYSPDGKPGISISSLQWHTIQLGTQARNLATMVCPKE